MNSKSRIPPLPPALWSEEAHEAYAILDSSATRDVRAASTLARVLAHYPKLGKAFYTFGRHLLLESSLPHRLRELATLRVAWHHKSEYEWYHHARFGKQIGLSDEEIKAVKQGPEAKIWTRADRCVLRLTDELCTRSEVDDATWHELNEILTQHQTMDLVFTVGQSVVTAWVIAAFGFGIEPGFESK
jgi:4-carboxymuconolactone decarboxylase